MNGPSSNVHKLRPLRLIKPTQWQGRNAPDRDWMIDGLIMRKTVCLLTGMGGVGKSLLAQQLMTSCAMGEPWIGFDVKPCRSFGIFSEDPADELWRRQEGICRHFNIDMRDLSGVTMMSLDELDEPALYRITKAMPEGAPTFLWNQISTHIIESEAQVVILDNVTSLFQANANYQEQVTGFMDLLKRLARDIDGAIILLQHPSKDGETDGSGNSGNKAWRNVSRQHLNLTYPKDEKEKEEFANRRVIKSGKSNYGEKDGWGIEYDRGVFVRVETKSVFTGMMSQLDRITFYNSVLRDMKREIKKGQRFSMVNGARNQVQVVLKKMPEYSPYGSRDIQMACEAMLDDGKLELVTIGSGTKATRCVRPVDVRYPGEPD